MSTSYRTPLKRLAACALGATVLSSLGHGQMVFSIDWHSPTVGLPDSWTGMPITEGDLLTPAAGMPSIGPLAVPGIAIPAGPPGIGLGLPAYPTPVELDAVSFGMDYPMDNLGAYPGDYAFSTDEFAIGLVGPPWPPDLLTEAPPGDSAADLWITPVLLPPGPLPPFAAPVGHTGLVDGDGMPSGSGFLYPGTGLIEPTFPGPPPDLGDTLDAVDLQVPPNWPPMGVWFSLDSFFVDPMIGVPNSASGPVNGYAGADILWVPGPGVIPMVWAPAPMLGLNIAGPDDLDALAIFENGSGVFEPSMQPYDWLTGTTDMVLFSVRRGSAVIGAPDSFFGIPIEEGDILTTPFPGGPSPFPGIFCAAENLGLATLRSTGVNFGDDLNALDTLGFPFMDCNGNGMEDVLDVLFATSTDGNLNGIPDECELLATPYCFCAAGAPCGNTDPNAGCANSTGVGALLSATGSSSVAADNLVLTVSQLPLNAFAFLFKANNAIGPFPFGDGFRCAGGGLVRFGVQNSGASGSISRGPGLAATYGILPFTTYRFHCWYRDPAGPCGFQFNTSSAISVSFLP